MAAPYWVGDEVLLKFTAVDGSGASPSTATVDVYDQANTKVVDAVSATISGSTITYNVAETVTDTAGAYRAVFTLVWTGTITRRHIIGFLVDNPATKFSTYGSVSDVEGLIGDIVDSRTFTESTIPSSETVQKLLDGVAAEINTNLAHEGYQAPVRFSESEQDAHAYRRLVYANAAGAAARVLSTLPMESYTFPEETRSGGDRREMLDRELWHLLQDIRKRRFKATRDVGILAEFFAGSLTDRAAGETKEPLFTRGKFDYPGSRVLQDS
jgi:hypothetical protein|tara:strand:- start:3919 stop:4725 length:807 start_codon:yes stop_codon:yes gene_type:complete